MISTTINNTAYQTLWTGDVACTCVCIEIGRITCWPAAQINIRITWLQNDGTPGPLSPSNRTPSITSSSHFGSAVDYGCLYIPVGNCAQVRITQVEIGIFNAVRIPAPPQGFMDVKICMWTGLIAGSVNVCNSSTNGGCNGPAGTFDKINLF